MKFKGIFIRSISLIVAIFLFYVNCTNTKAETLTHLQVSEIASDYLKGYVSQPGAVEVYNKSALLGEGQVYGEFTINFNSKITSGTVLTVKFISDKEETQIVSVTYQPITKINRVDDKQKILSGTGFPNTLVSAYINEKALMLKKYDNTTGQFEFYPSNELKNGALIKIVSNGNGVKSISYAQVTAAPSPNKPVVNAISNKDVYITGTAEINSTVFVQTNGVTYTQKLVNTNQFKIRLSKTLKEGTSVKVYVKDLVGRISSTVTLVVLDKIPPKTPTVNKISDKTFVISGKTDSGATVYIKRNSKQIAIIKADGNGIYSYRVPLQTRGTVFEIYAIDQASNTSPVVKAVVSSQSRSSKTILNAPIIRQMPELPRGCEVTSLAMLLNHAGIKVSKMTLAQQVKKDPTPYKIVKGKKYFGNPNYSFVGNMYTFSKPGFGVFHKPIEDLAKKYLPNRIVNLTGQSFDSVLNYVSAGHPVWVINTSWFSVVPQKYWETWYTPQGPIRITKKEHSVLVTGYDSKYVYFNDPLDGMKNKKKPLKSFIDGWKQYGSQAISYY
ncbi:MAG: C39 family peptidase [Anoxybacillus sp.]|nr:C39 family peptidase [Anoxybacillus sp.]MCL6586222.1 C39 family peptidase [Anoxybacillus sp.]